jgi:hypothetical protein
MLIRRLVTILAATAGLTSAVAIAQTTTTTTRTQTSNLPPVGLASTETAQINVTNIAASSTTETASCAGTISFVNAAGTVIGSATSFTVASGVTSSASLPFAKTASTSTRTEVRGIIALTTTSDVPCALSTSLETYDTTSGVTHMYLSAGEPMLVGMEDRGTKGSRGVAHTPRVHASVNAEPPERRLSPGLAAPQSYFLEEFTAFRARSISVKSP